MSEGDYMDDCQQVDRYDDDDELDISWMEEWTEKVAVVSKAKAKLLDKKRDRGRTRCPCGPRGSRTMQVMVVGSIEHVRAWCPVCKFRMME